MGFRVLRPQWLRGIGMCRAGPHIRLTKRRTVALSPSPAFSLQFLVGEPSRVLLPHHGETAAASPAGLYSSPRDRWTRQRDLGAGSPTAFDQIGGRPSDFLMHLIQAVPVNAPEQF